MATVALTLTAPTTRDDNSPVPITDIGPVQLEARNDAGTYSNLGNAISAAQKTFNINNVPGGKWWYRATWKDLKGGGDSQAETSVIVPLGKLNAGTIAAALV